LFKNFENQARNWMARAELGLRHHPRAISGAVLTLLLGTGVTAFGVAPLTTLDDSPLATRVIQQDIELAGLEAQIAALDEIDLSLHRNDLTRSSDTADSLLRRLGVHDPEAAQFLRQDAIAQRILTGQPGKQAQVRAESGPGGGLLIELVVRGPAADASESGSHFTRTTVRRTASGLEATSERVALVHEVRLGSGTIESSLFAAADDARLPDAVTMQLAEIFGADIDFRRELRKGDTFSVVYETPTADGEPVTWGSGSGRVLSARFLNGNHTHEAIWFQDGEQRGSYYGPDGLSKARLFLSSPLAFSRVTSGFAMRFHPIQKTWKAHLGVDYGAPTGTPVRTVGGGTVEFAGVQNGYGNVVVVRHSGERSTVYAHLSRIGVRRGEHVSQGATIGAVGATGWATGPHLHFEFKINGSQVDPVKIARASEAVQLSTAARLRFDTVARTAQQQLASASRPAVALARME
jgi:murein DD-endopeptidase MepM/ murein hydrolase activator NlpD